MLGEQNIDTVVDVEPFRMMVRLFRQQRNLGHEPESTVKIIEAEAARDRISLRIIDPAGQIGESFLPFLFGQLRNHGNSPVWRSEEHTSELQSLMRISYAVFCLKKKKKKQITNIHAHKQSTLESKTHKITKATNIQPVQQHKYTNTGT